MNRYKAIQSTLIAVLCFCIWMALGSTYEAKEKKFKFELTGDECNLLFNVIDSSRWAYSDVRKVQFILSAQLRPQLRDTTRQK
jgi:hypothetical protein